MTYRLTIIGSGTGTVVLAHFSIFNHSKMVKIKKNLSENCVLAVGFHLAFEFHKNRKNNFLKFCSYNLNLGPPNVERNVRNHKIMKFVGVVCLLKIKLKLELFLLFGPKYFIENFQNILLYICWPKLRNWCEFGQH